MFFRLPIQKDCPNTSQCRNEKLQNLVRRLPAAVIQTGSILLCFSPLRLFPWRSFVQSAQWECCWAKGIWGECNISALLLVWLQGRNTCGPLGGSVCQWTNNWCIAGALSSWRRQTKQADVPECTFLRDCISWKKAWTLLSTSSTVFWHCWWSR